MRNLFNSATASSFKLMSRFYTLLIMICMISIGYSQPVAICQDITVSANDACEGQVFAEDVDDGSYDPTGGPLRMRIWPIGPFPLGISQTRLTVRDINGATDKCHSTITVNDVTPPIFTVYCPFNITLCGPQNVYWQPPEADDNCGTPYMTSSSNSGDFCDVGITVVTYVFTDGSNNTATCNFRIRIDDPLSCTSVTFNRDIEELNNYNELIDMNVYPNPAAELVNLNFRADQESVIEVNIYDLLGAVQLKKEFEVHKGVQTIELDVNNLTDGMHTIRITDGNKEYAVPLVKSSRF